MTTVKAVIAFVVVGLLISLSAVPAGAEYPPSDPPSDVTATTIATKVAGISQTSGNAGNNAGNNANLAFTGRTIGEVAALGGALVVAGGAFWLVGQRRRPDTL